MLRDSVFESEDDNMASNNCSPSGEHCTNGLFDFEQHNSQVSRPPSNRDGMSMPFAMPAAADHQNFGNTQRHFPNIDERYRDRGDDFLAVSHVSNMTGGQDIAIGTEAHPTFHHTSFPHDSRVVVPTLWLGPASLDHNGYSNATDNLRIFGLGNETIHQGNATQYQTLQVWHPTNVPQDFAVDDSFKNNDPGLCLAVGPSSPKTPASYSPWPAETYMTTAASAPSALPLIELEDVEAAPRRSSGVPWSLAATLTPPQGPSYDYHVSSVGDLTDNRSLSEYSHEPYFVIDEREPLLTPATSTNANGFEPRTPSRKSSQKTRPKLGRRKSKVSTTSLFPYSQREETCECGTCGTTFTGSYCKGNYQRHLRLKHGDKDFPCEELGCLRTYQRQDARLKHYRSKHSHLAGAPLSRKLHRST